MATGLLSADRGDARLNAGSRAQALAALPDEVFDVLVVGGGVTGAGTALDAASRGLRTLLVEAQDWASGTSSKSSKLVHGGLRYLQMLDFGLVREALRERSLLAGHIAPHLVHPLPVLYPLHSRVRERAYVGAGVALYDLMAQRGTDKAGRLPRHRHLSKRKAIEIAPGLDPASLAGAVLYYDGQVDDARLVLELVRTAVAHGALALSRLLLQSIEAPAGARSTTAGPSVLATLRDAESGSLHQVRARTAVLATGPWTEDTEALAGVTRGTSVRPSKGVHLVVERERIQCGAGLIMRTATSVLFVLPWGDHWVIGTTDTDWPYSKGRPLATASDVSYILAQVNTLLLHPLGREDVEAVYAGLRPLVAGTGVVRGPGEGPSTGTARLSREHSVQSARPGLVVVSGGKYTTYRVMAREAVDAAVRSGGLRAPASRTARIQLLGARGWSEARKAALLEQALDAGLDEAAARHLAGRYGSLMGDLLELVREEPSLARPVGGGYLAAEVAYSVAHEGARHLDDVMARRLRMEIEMRDAGSSCVTDVARVMAPLLGWDATATRAEIDDYSAQACLRARAAATATDDAQADAMAAAVPPLLELP